MPETISGAGPATRRSRRSECEALPGLPPRSQLVGRDGSPRRAAAAAASAPTQRAEVGRAEGAAPRGAGRPRRRAPRREIARATSPPRPLLEELGSLELSSSLYEIREVLRERLPALRGRGACSRSASPSNRSSPSTSARSGSTAGCTTRTARARSRFVSPEGARVAVTDDRLPATSGPMSSSSTPACSGNRTPGPRLHGVNRAAGAEPARERLDSRAADLATGSQVEVRCPDPVVDPQAVRATILGELGQPRARRRRAGGTTRTSRPDPPAGADRRRIGSRLDRPLRRAADGAGGLDRRPPLQAARLHRAPAAPVLDRPRLRRSRADLRARLGRAEGRAGGEGAANSSPSTGLPFQVVNLTAGAGFAGANNHGIEASRGEAAAAAQLRRDPRPPGLARRRCATFYESDGEDRRARPEAALRGRLAAARRPLLPSRHRRRALGERPLLQGPAPGLPGSQRRPRRCPR